MLEFRIVPCGVHHWKIEQRVHTPAGVNNRTWAPCTNHPYQKGPFLNRTQAIDTVKFLVQRELEELEKTIKEARRQKEDTFMYFLPTLSQDRYNFVETLGEEGQIINSQILEKE